MSAPHTRPGSQNGRPTRPDGVVPDSGRLADIQAIQDLAIAYGHAVDDRDWARWQSLFTPDAHIDYTSAGGIEGTPAELVVWFPEAFTAFDWCMHSMSTHEITFTAQDQAVGRVHVFNRNGVTHEGQAEILDVGAVYEDTYARTGNDIDISNGNGDGDGDGDRWRFSSRVEHTRFIEGGGFAAMLREALQM